MHLQILTMLKRKSFLFKTHTETVPEGLRSAVYQERKNEPETDHQDSFSMSFEQEGFTLEHERGNRSWPWQALSNYIESPHFFHLYFDSRSFFLVPKSGFRDRDEVSELRHLLKEKVRKEKR